MEMTKKQKFERYYQVLDEIRWVKDVVEMTDKHHFEMARDKIVLAKEFNFNKEETFEFLHMKLNRLVRELKELKIALHSKDVEIIRQLKSDVWCGCSAKYQHEFMSNNQSHMI